MSTKEDNDRTIDRINKDINKYNIDINNLADVCQIKSDNLKRILDKKYPAPYELCIIIHKYINDQKIKSDLSKQ
jgi:hypothetical protein